MYLSFNQIIGLMIFTFILIFGSIITFLIVCIKAFGLKPNGFILKDYNISSNQEECTVTTENKDEEYAPELAVTAERTELDDITDNLYMELLKADISSDVPQLDKDGLYDVPEPNTSFLYDNDVEVITEDYEAEIERKLKR